ncbi:hypothetical protein T492DRAFT_1067030 [Pavlovales sp. CCMP2436]|nr:hypothetical protein T492DRAFT_1067030 [Pavlovales sp. CCMP2436]
MKFVLALIGLAAAAGFQPQMQPAVARHSLLRRSASGMVGPRPIHRPDGFTSVFTVEKATPEQMKDLGVDNWPTWSTRGSVKYMVGERSLLKVYSGNELSHIIAGKMEIIPEETGVPVLVQPGDFVTFPDEFRCYWHVIEEVRKHYYLYD